MLSPNWNTCFFQSETNYFADDPTRFVDVDVKVDVIQGLSDALLWVEHVLVRDEKHSPLIRTDQAADEKAGPAPAGRRLEENCRQRPSSFDKGCHFSVDKPNADVHLRRTERP